MRHGGYLPNARQIAVQNGATGVPGRLKSNEKIPNICNRLRFAVILSALRAVVWRECAGPIAVRRKNRFGCLSVQSRDSSDIGVFESACRGRAASIRLAIIGELLTNLIGILAAFAIAALVALYLTPLIAHFAVKMGAIDRPDGRRKSQTQPVPRGGGIVVALAAFVGAFVVMCCVAPAEDSSSAVLLHGLLPAIAILLVVGIIDDVFTLTGIYKLIGQVLAVSVLVAGGTQFDQISMFGFLLPLGDLRIPLTLFFCLGAINAFNLIDGADALASSIGAVICLALGIITASRGDMAASLVCFALAGALFGFLRHNISPARVYLGDTGSMLIGLVVAAVAIDCSIKQEVAFALAVPLALCAIPILDVVAALIRRVVTGQSVFAADRGHLHHALLLRGWSVNKTVMIITGLAALTCGGALIGYFTNNDLFAMATAIGVVAVLAIARIFGHAEVALVASRSMSFAREILSQARGAGQRKERARFNCKVVANGIVCGRL